MGKHVFQGRYTTSNSEDIVVFIIGMRINKPLAVHKWLPVLLAMPGMIRELYTYKDELGFLGAENYFGLKTSLMVQYWKSTDELIAYARNEKHLAAWKKFNHLTRNNASVGVYHETYHITKGNYESIYVNMPRFGLSQALPHIPVTPEKNTSKERLNKA